MNYCVEALNKDLKTLKKMGRGKRKEACIPYCKRV